VKRPDIVAAGVLAALGVFVFVETRGYPPSLTPGAPGPAFFPSMLAGLLVALAMALLFQGVRSRAPEPAPTPASDFDWRPLARWVAVFGAVSIFLVLVERSDFLLLLLPLLAVVMAVMGERRPRTLVVAPTLFVAFVYVVFVRLFGVPFPTVF